MLQNKANARRYCVARQQEDQRPHLDIPSELDRRESVVSNDFIRSFPLYGRVPCPLCHKGWAYFQAALHLESAGVRWTH
jgi:hypothetical protein